MLSLVVVDRSAESRHRFVGELQRLLGENLPDLAFVPRISIVPRAPHEVRFHAAPDVCVVGREIVESGTGEIAELRRAMPTTVLLAELPRESPGLAVIEHLARAGVDDVLSPACGVGEFLQKLVLLVRKRGNGRRGHLVIVDAGKGGQGVTSVAAALAESGAVRGKSAVFVDFDVDTQDGARFLLARPYLNETLQAIFDGQKPLTREFVEEALVPFGDGAESFKVLPPIPSGEVFFDPLGAASRVLVGLLELLDEMFEVTIVDCGAARGTVLEVLYRAADVAVLVGTGDPAAIFPTVERGRRIKASLGGAGRLIVVENRSGRGGVPSGFLHREVCAALGDSASGVSAGVLPYCSRGAMWPGSGDTMFRCAGRGLHRAVAQLWGEVAPARARGEGGEATAETLLARSWRGVSERLHRTRRGVLRPRAAPLLPAPPSSGGGEGGARGSLPLLPPSEAIDPRSLISGLRDAVGVG